MTPRLGAESARESEQEIIRVPVLTPPTYPREGIRCNPGMSGAPSPPCSRLVRTPTPWHFSKPRRHSNTERVGTERGPGQARSSGEVVMDGRARSRRRRYLKWPQTPPLHFSCHVPPPPRYAAQASLPRHPVFFLSPAFHFMHSKSTFKPSLFTFAAHPVLIDIGVQRFASE